MPKNEALETKRHSLAHLMAACIQEMFPEAKFGVGPTVEDGFYYDVMAPAGREPVKPRAAGSSE